MQFRIPESSPFSLSETASEMSPTLARDLQGEKITSLDLAASRDVTCAARR